VLLNLMVSLVVTCLIWKVVFLKEFHLFQGSLSVDFFNTLGVVFTIIGLIIAIYQIAVLRTENEIRIEAEKAVHRANFINEARRKIVLIHQRMMELQELFNGNSYSQETVVEFIKETNHIEHVLTELHFHQERITTIPIIDCENCVNLIKDLRDDLYKSLRSGGQVIIKKNSFNSKMGAIIRKLTSFEFSLNA
jgi:hypothetical protein